MRRPAIIRWVSIVMIGMISWPAAALPQPPASGTLATLPAPTSIETDDFLGTLQKQALPQLIQSLTDKKTVKRLRVTHVVGDVDDLLASPYLIRAYRDNPNESVRCKLLESIGKLHDPALFNWLLVRLNDPSIGIQSFGIWALGELQTPKARIPLLQKLRSRNRYIQMTAIDALGKTGKNMDVAYELETFLDNDDVQIRFLAAKALSGTAAIDAVPDVMVRLTQEPSVDVQEALARTAGQIGGTVAAGHFIELLKNPLSQATDHWAEIGLEAADPSVVIAAIAPLVEGDDFRMKLSALRVLGEMDIPAPMDVHSDWMTSVERWAHGPDLLARQAALRFLERFESAQTQSAGKTDQ